MNRFFVNSHRTLLHLLFAIFSMAFVTSFIAVSCLPKRDNPTDTIPGGIAGLLSFAGLFSVSILLRNVSPRLALVGLYVAVLGFIVLGMRPAA